MTKDLTGKNAVITGGARGIGYAIAERLLDAGARVAICATKQASLDAAVASLSAKGEVFGAVADVSKLEDARRFVTDVVARFGGIDILVNNAAIRTYKSVAELGPEEWDRMLAVNLSGPFYMSHEVLPSMRERGGGDIVNVSSLSSTSAFAGGAGYNASKAGLNGLSDAMMLDHRYDGVRVTQVLPGSTNTEFNGPEGRAEWKIAPENIAEVVSMLLRMPRNVTVSRIDLKPSQPSRRQV